MFRVYTHHQEHQTLSCSIWISAPCDSHGNIGTAHTTYTAALKTTTHPKTRRRKPYPATQRPVLLMMGVCTRNMSSEEYINKITLLHQVGVSNYFVSQYYKQQNKIPFHIFTFPVAQFIHSILRHVTTHNT